MSKSTKPTKAKKTAPSKPALKGSRARKLQADERTIAIIAGLARIQATAKEAGAVLGVPDEPRQHRPRDRYPEQLSGRRYANAPG